MLPTVKKELESFIAQSLRELGSDAFAVSVDSTSDVAHGDLTCTVALKLSKVLKKNPLDIANRLVDILHKNLDAPSLRHKIKFIEVKKPGFINFFLTPVAFYDILYKIFEQKEDYGRLALGEGKKVQIEFVSANPTGPLTIAHARQAVVGDALGNVLKFAGYDVTKEYYVNDEGNQINILGRSIALRAKEILGETIFFPEDHYQGDYIRDIARDYIQEHNIQTAAQITVEDPQIAQYGVEYLLKGINEELQDFGVNFDTWSYQSAVATNQNIEKVLELLDKRGFIYNQDGAKWFKSTNFGDDKDRVVKKSDGSFTYLAPDIVYHKDKYGRGFDKLINIWGPDHHGYIPRLKAAVQALGYPVDSLDVLIVQLATIYRDGQPLSMSTRRGQFITLREVMSEVGVDAARYFFLMRHLEAHLDFDLELAKKETPENPVYYIQYAHARIYSVMEVAKEVKLFPKESSLSLLKEPSEIDLLRCLGSFPDIIQVCAENLDPFTLTAYLLELATCVHKFYDQCRVVGEDKGLSAERLALLAATRIVLASGLKILGLSVPNKM